MLEVPASAASVSLTWLTRALRAAGALGPARLAGFESVPIGRQTGFASELCRLDLRYESERGDAPASVVIKLPPLDRLVRERVLAYGHFPREVAVYNELTPRFPLPTPRCFAARTNGRGGGVLLLEHVHVAIERAEQPGLQRARVAVDALARLHASCWDDASVSSGFVGADVEQRHRAAALLFQLRLSGLCTLCPELPAPFVERSADIARFIAAQSQRARMSHSTLLHGDLRADDLLFVGQDSPPVLIDFQQVTWGPGASDLASFIGQGLSSELRRAAQDELLSRYLEALREHGVRGYGAQQLHADYRRGLLAAVVAIANLAGTLLEVERRAGSDDEAIAEPAASMLPGMTARFDTLSARAISALLDNDALCEL